MIKFITSIQRRGQVPDTCHNIMAMMGMMEAPDGVYVPADNLKNYCTGKWPNQLMCGNCIDGIVNKEKNNEKYCDKCISKKEEQYGT